MGGWGRTSRRGPVARSVLVATIFACASAAEAQDDEDDIMVRLDERAWPDAPPEADPPGAALTLDAGGASFTFTVPPHCAAWRLGAAIAVSCAKSAWPKLNGRILIRFGPREGRLPLLRADPAWSSLPPPAGQYRLQARKSLRVGDHVGDVEAYCDNAWMYCTEMRVDGALYGPHTILRFEAATWDGETARRLGDALVAASSLGATALQVP